MEKEQKKKLVQVGEYRLYGNVQSLNKVKLDGSERESLLLAFSTAKVSIPNGYYCATEIVSYLLILVCIR